jgi:DNA-binding beta-propeller fold protein YncE
MRLTDLRLRSGIQSITAILLGIGVLVSVDATAAQAAPPYTVYAVNSQCPTDNSVTSVTGNGTSWTVGATDGVGSCPAGVAFSPNGSTAYVVNAGGNTITPIDTATFVAGAAFSTGVSTPIFAQVTPNGNSIVTAGTGGNGIAVISTSNTSDVQPVTVGNAPLGIAILPNSSAAYVANSGDGTVSVVSLTGTPAVTKTIKFPSSGCKGPGDDAATPNGKAVYVVCSNFKIWKINTATNKAAATGIKIKKGSGSGGALQEIVITPNSKTAYVSNNNDGAVYPVTLKSGVVGAGIPVSDAWGLAISPDGNYVLAGDGTCCFVTTNISSIAVSTNTVVSTFNTGGFTMRWLAVQP